MMKNNNILNNNKGFSLIEMLIAITIFAVGLLAMAQLQTHSIVYNAQAQRYTEATIYAQSAMDAIRMMNYEDITVAKIVPVMPDIPAGFTLTPEVIDNDPLPDTKRIEVDVEWSYKGVKNYTLTTVIAKHIK